MTTKVDIINDALSEIRISGLTAIPIPEELEISLAILEKMAAEFEASNIRTGYAFEQMPDLNTPHNLERKFWQSYEVLLAVRLLNIFGKSPTTEMMMRAQTAYSFLSSQTAVIPRMYRSIRQPVGSKDSFQFGRFYTPVEQAPIAPTTHTMFVGDIDEFAEDYGAWLKIGETIASYTITTGTGLTVGSSSSTDTTVTYKVQADSSNLSTILPLRIVIVSSEGRRLTREFNFSMIPVEEL